MTPLETQLAVSAAVAVIVFVALQFTAAPYGRYTPPRRRLTVPNRLGWILMEGVAVAAILLFFVRERPAMTSTLWVLLGLWQLHYLNRAFIFPLRTRTRGKRMPLSVMLMAMGFNTWNGYLNSRWLGENASQYAADWMLRPAFIAGTCVFAAGFAINVWSDEILMRLRGDSGNGYAIPRGGLFRVVSCPNYFGELIEWSGWALMTWSPAALVFVAWTAANLVPRARSHHRWYRDHFPEYPRDRKAIIPFVY